MAGSTALAFPLLQPGRTAKDLSPLTRSRVALATSSDRADIVFKALLPFSEEIKRDIGDKRVVLKPNNVLIYVPLACTHVVHELQDA